MNRKKIFMLAIAACLFVLSVAGTSLAYFTDIDAKTNVFTSGNVDITLNYDNEETKLYPGQTYANKAASIENVGTEEAYVGAIIDITLPTGIANPLTADEIAVIFTNLNTNTTVKYETITGGYRIYCVVANKLNTTTGQNTASIFDSISIPAAWGHAEVSNLKEIKISGYAVQTVGFTDAVSALTAAFTDWTNYPNI